MGICTLVHLINVKAIKKKAIAVLGNERLPVICTQLSRNSSMSRCPHFCLIWDLSNLSFYHREHCYPLQSIFHFSTFCGGNKLSPLSVFFFFLLFFLTVGRTLKPLYTCEGRTDNFPRVTAPPWGQLGQTGGNLDGHQQAS